MKRNIDNIIVELSQISTTLSNVSEAMTNNHRVDAPDIISGCCNYLDRIVDDLIVINQEEL